MRIRFIAIGILLLMILVALSGFRQVSETVFKQGPVVVQVPFGNAPDSAGRAIGIDGRAYGPLTFATNGRTTVVADTYRERLLFVTKGRITAQLIPGKMIEDMAIDKAGNVLLADNRAMAVWLYTTRHAVKKLLQFDARAGYTEALWHVGLTPLGAVLVERIRFGHGSYVSRLDEYTKDGRFIRSLAESKAGREGVEPLAGRPIADPIKSFQVSPDGSIYVEPTAVQASDRVIRIYGQDGLFIGQVVIRSPERIQRSDFLGISRRGWIYLAINMDVKNKARVLIVNARGDVMADIHVPAVPVYAADYGRVLPSGVLYLDDSTHSAYQIRQYVPVTRQVWRWTGI